VYLRLLTQLTELQLMTGGEDLSLALAYPPKAPLAEMTALRALNLNDNTYFRLSQDFDAQEATLPLVLPPHLTRLEVLVPFCQPGMFWRHITACTGLVSLTVDTGYISAAADHPSWMLYHLAKSLEGLQHLEVSGQAADHAAPGMLLEVVGLLAGTEAGQQQEEQGWDWQDLAAPGLGATAVYNSVVVPPPNMGSLTALRTLDFLGHGYQFRCCGPHHWRALAGCRDLQQLHWVEACQVPPAGVQFPGVTDLKLVVCAPAVSGTVAVLGAFPALQQLLLRLDLPSTEVGFECWFAVTAAADSILQLCM
jgi:hypothetical protein